MQASKIFGQTQGQLRAVPVNTGDPESFDTEGKLLQLLRRIKIESQDRNIITDEAGDRIWRIADEAQVLIEQRGL